MNVNVEELRVTVIGGALTLRVTGMDTGLLEAPLEVIVMAPLYVAGVKLVIFTETVSEPGVLPDVGVTDSQDPPEAAAVKARFEPPVMVTICTAGGALSPIV